MDWLSALMQFTFLEGGRALDKKTKLAAEMGKRAAIMSLACLLSCAWFFAAIIIGVLELGRQADQGSGFHWSGLLGASLTIFLFGIATLATALLWSRYQKDMQEKIPESVKRREELKELIEHVAIAFFTQLAVNLKNSPSSREDIHEETR